MSAHEPRSVWRGWLSGGMRGLCDLLGGGCGRRGAHAPAGGLSLSTAGGRLLLHLLDALHQLRRQGWLLPLQTASSGHLHRAAQDLKP